MRVSAVTWRAYPAIACIASCARNTTRDGLDQVAGRACGAPAQCVDLGDALDSTANLPANEALVTHRVPPAMRKEVLVSAAVRVAEEVSRATDARRDNTPRDSRPSQPTGLTSYRRLSSSNRILRISPKWSTSGSSARCTLSERS